MSFFTLVGQWLRFKLRREGELNALLAEMRQVLSFYGDASSWEDEDRRALILEDRGRRARAFLDRSRRGIHAITRIQRLEQLRKTVEQFWNMASHEKVSEEAYEEALRLMGQALRSVQETESTRYRRSAHEVGGMALLGEEE